MSVIATDMFGLALAFCVGAGIATLNYAISRYVLKKCPKFYFPAQIVRQLIQILYLVLLFVFRRAAPFNQVWLLVGGCAGITLPMIWFTFKLIKYNDSLDGKEGSSNG